MVVTDVSAGEAVIPVMGPRARDLLARVSPDDFSNAVHPFGTAREIEIGMGLARAHRVTYVGELGWEIYVASDQAAHVFEALVEAGEDLGLKLCGLHAMDSCRIEKAYRHFGHDITDEDHVLEAGLGFAVKTGKGDFIGRDAVLRKREAGLGRRLLQFRLSDPEPLLYHGEPILRDGRIVGHVTSGNYGHALGACDRARLCRLRGRRGGGEPARLGLCDRCRRAHRRGRGEPDADVRSAFGAGEGLGRELGPAAGQLRQQGFELGQHAAVALPEQRDAGAAAKQILEGADPFGAGEVGELLARVVGQAREHGLALAGERFAIAAGAGAVARQEHVGAGRRQAAGAGEIGDEGRAAGGIAREVAAAADRHADGA